MNITGQGWSALLSVSAAAELSIKTPWTEKDLNKLSIKRLVGMCLDKTTWHKDLLRAPAPPNRIFPDQTKTRFKEIVFLREGMFLFVPQSGFGKTRTVSVGPDGTLIGIGSFSRKELSYLFRAAWCGFASQVLLGPIEVEEWRGGSNHGSIRYWVAGHWRQLPSDRSAHQIDPNGEDRRHLGQTWVNQFHVHWDDNKPCRECSHAS